MNLQVNTFWTDLFANCFLVNDYGNNNKEGATSIKNTLTHDDMLFFVSKIASEEVIYSCNFYYKTNFYFFTYFLKE